MTDWAAFSRENVVERAKKLVAAMPVEIMRWLHGRHPDVWEQLERLERHMLALADGTPHTDILRLVARELEKTLTWANAQYKQTEK